MLTLLSLTTRLWIDLDDIRVKIPLCLSHWLFLFLDYDSIKIKIFDHLVSCLGISNDSLGMSDLLLKYLNMLQQSLLNYILYRHFSPYLHLALL